MKEYIKSKLDNGPVSYLDVSFDKKCSLPGAKAQLIEYFIGNEDSLDAVLEICFTKDGIVNCQYVLSAEDVLSGEMPGEDIEIAICAIANKKDGLTLNTLLQCLSKHKSEYKVQAVPMMDISEPKVNKQIEETKKVKTTENKNSNTKMQRTLSSSYIVSKKSANNSVAQEIEDKDNKEDIEKHKEESTQDNETKEPNETENIKKPKETKKNTKKVKRSRDGPPEHEVSRRIPKFDASEDKKEQIVELNKGAEENEYKIVKKIRKEKRTKCRLDEKGYLVSELEEVNVEYEEKVKIRPQCITEEKPIRHTKKRDSKQLGLESFFKPKQ